MTRPAARTSRPLSARADMDRRAGWMAYANCQGVRAALFFPGQGDPTAPAKAVCEGCVVRDACLEYAMSRPFQKYGVWGGMSEKERRRLRRQRARSARVARLDGAA